ncbi:MAG: hypothetical protein IH873_00650 [Chloroflexi bacterium]|nr:hypothetical protein [Chloroflexota bacterium]
MRKILAFVVALSVINVGILLYQIWPEGSDSPVVRPINFEKLNEESRQFEIERRLNSLETQQFQERWTYIPER